MKTFDIKLTGYVGGWQFDAQTVRDRLCRKKDNEVHVLIDSLGGDVATALSIAAEFRNHGNVVVHFQGMNASAATIASMGAKKVCMDENAMYLIHKCSMAYFQWASVNADKIETEIEELKKMQADLNTIDANVAQMYAKKCKKTCEQLITVMSIGAWMNATTAKEWGFVDEIESDGETAKPHMTASMASDFFAAAIPLPPIKIEDTSLLQNIAKAIGLDANGNPQNNPKPKTEPIMMKFVMMAALLAVEAFELIEGHVTLDEEQMQKIEDSMAAAKTKAEADAKEISDRDEKIATLEARIKELESKPAEEPGKVVDEGGAAPADDTLAHCIEVHNSVKAMKDFLRN